MSDPFSRICDHPCCIVNHVTCECWIFCQCDHGDGIDRKDIGTEQFLDDLYEKNKDNVPWTDAKE